MLGRMFGHEFHALVIFQKFLIADDFAALFGFGPLMENWESATIPGLASLVRSSLHRGRFWR